MKQNYIFTTLFLPLYQCYAQNSYKKVQEIHQLKTKNQILFHKKSPPQDFIKRTLHKGRDIHIECSKQFK